MQICANTVCQRIMKYPTLLICVLVPTMVAGAKLCSVGPDCPREMCCKGPQDTQGYCEPLKTNGEDCQMYSGIPSWGQSSGKVTECRCHDGLYCRSDASNPPLGGRGDKYLILVPWVCCAALH